MPRTKAQFLEMQDKTKERIHDAGLILFAQRGVSATGVTEIARQAGISLGLMYHYYPSKEALFAALVSMALEGAMEALTSCAHPEEPAAVQISRMSGLASSALSRDDRTAYYFLLLLQAGLSKATSSETSPPPLERAAFPFAHLEGLILTGQAQGTVKAGDPRQLAQLYWAAFQGLCLYKITMKSFTPPAAMLLDGILLKDV